eukprot:894528_1
MTYYDTLDSLYELLIWWLSSVEDCTVRTVHPEVFSRILHQMGRLNASVFEEIYGTLMNNSDQMIINEKADEEYRLGYRVVCECIRRCYEAGSPKGQVQSDEVAPESIHDTNEIVNDVHAENSDSGSGNSESMYVEKYGEGAQIVPGV